MILNIQKHKGGYMKFKAKAIVDSQEIKTKSGALIHKTHVITSENEVIPVLSRTPVKAGEILELSFIPKVLFKD